MSALKGGKLLVIGAVAGCCAGASGCRQLPIAAAPPHNWPQHGAMNAADQARSLELAQAIASVAALFREHFPDARANLKPWRDDPLTRAYGEPETVDLSFHFPGWSPRIQCRSVLVQLRLAAAPGGGDAAAGRPPLLGVSLRGLTYAGERWSLATVGDWRASGPHPPSPAVEEILRLFCRQLFQLFETAGWDRDGGSPSGPAAEAA